MKGTPLENAVKWIIPEHAPGLLLESFPLNTNGIQERSGFFPFFR